MSAVRLAVISDIHYASPAEAARGPSLLAPIHPLRRAVIRQYRHWVWMRDVFAHNHLLDRFMNEAASFDMVVANGDFSCDTAYIGISDDAAFASASMCLARLQEAFGARLFTTIGDHELGKKMMGADTGGLRLASFERAIADLKLPTHWRREVGRYVLMGVTSSLLAYDIYEAESLPEERAAWRAHAEQHREELHQQWSAIEPGRRIILFCHDPTALPFLACEEWIRERLSQVECTVVGHLHSPFILRAARLLAGLPPIHFLGHTPRRLSLALRQARGWRDFRIQLCPSPSGMQLFKDGGWLSLEIDPEGRTPVQVQTHALPW